MEKNTLSRKSCHDEALYLIQNYTENCMYDIARGCAEMAHGIAIISDKEYDRACAKIEKARDNFHIFD